MSTMTGDPKPRYRSAPTKTKYVCKRKGCMKKINSISLENNDPYCSNTCARAAYGNPLPRNGIWSSTHTKQERNPLDES